MGVWRGAAAALMVAAEGIPVCESPIPAMRDWIAGCEWEGSDSVDDLSEREVVLVVDLFYDGSIEGFIRDTAQGEVRTNRGAYRRRDPSHHRRRPHNHCE